MGETVGGDEAPLLGDAVGFNVGDTVGDVVKPSAGEAVVAHVGDAVAGDVVTSVGDAVGGGDGIVPMTSTTIQLLVLSLRPTVQ